MDPADIMHPSQSDSPISVQPLPDKPIALQQSQSDIFSPIIAEGAKFSKLKPKIDPNQYRATTDRGQLKNGHDLKQIFIESKANQIQPRSRNGSNHKPRATSYDNIDIPISKLHSNLAQQYQERIKLINGHHGNDNHLNTKSMENSPTLSPSTQSFNTLARTLFAKSMDTSRDNDNNKLTVHRPPRSMTNGSIPINGKYPSKNLDHGLI